MEDLANMALTLLGFHQDDAEPTVQSRHSRTLVLIYLFIYLLFKPKNLPRQLPGLPAGLRRPCGC